MTERTRDDEQEIRRSRAARQAQDWGLVLSAAGIASRVVPGSEGFSLCVASADAARAERELAAYAEDVAAHSAASARSRRRMPEVTGPAPVGVALLVTLAVVGFYFVTGPAWSSEWTARGSADADALRHGELWRAVTALSLHADLAHLGANALFGSFFLAAAGRSLGPGLALALVILAGAGANLLNGFLRPGEHVSIGASAAVFAAVGLLSGVGVVRRSQRGERVRAALLPLAAGLGILSMLGTAGGRVDVFAHLFGLVLGVGVGGLTALALRQPPRTPAQWGFGVAAVVLVLGCWRLAR